MATKPPTRQNSYRFVLCLLQKKHVFQFQLKICSRWNTMLSFFVQHKQIRPSVLGVLPPIDPYEWAWPTKPLLLGGVGTYLHDSCRENYNFAAYCCCLLGFIQATPPRSSVANRCKAKWLQEKSTPGDDETLLRETKHGQRFSTTKNNTAKWCKMDNEISKDFMGCTQQKNDILI